MAIYVDDQELVAAHRAGDSDAFDELVGEHRGLLFSHAQRKLYSVEAAEDAVQETLIRAYRALPRFNGEYRLGPWLHRIMSNVCIDEANRRRRDGEKAEKIASQPSTRLDAPGVEEELGLDFDDSHITSALDELPDSYREALELRFVDQLDYEQVASIAGVTEQNVRARVSRARASMRIALKGVAALPVVLFGMLRRGEKAAAAATSTTGAAMAGSSATTTTLMAQVAPTATATLPSLAEVASTAAQVAPVAVPAIAKAAVGIGLAAAVFAPTADSAIHYAVESVAGAEVLLVNSSEKADQPVILQSSAEDAPTDSNDLAVNAGISNSGSSGVDASASSVTGEVQPVAVEMLSSELTVVAAGAGRSRLEGTVSLRWGAEEVSGQLGAASQLRLVSGSEDSVGRQRLDGLLVVQLAGSVEPLEIRIAGFATSSDERTSFSGVYRLDSPIESLTYTEGEIEGQLQWPGQEQRGSLELILHR
jgi:RNA polymerase sigma-70 factor (ECF subfamily)